MKKIYSIICLFILFCPLYAGTLGVNPGVGGFNINMNGENNQGGTTWSDGQVKGSATSSQYSYEQMIALGGVWGMEVPVDNGIAHGTYQWDRAESNNPLVITATCPNGFEFVSASNEAARRPFELYLIVKADHNNSNSNPGRNVHRLEDELVAGDNSGSIKYEDLDSNKPTYNWTNLVWEDEDEDNSYKFQFIWFDVVLCLPGEVSDTGSLVYNGNVYNLVEAADYSALLTISLDWNGQHQEITIPMSGYFSLNEPQESKASLVVRPRAAAANLDIRGMIGVPQNVADIEFMSEIGSDDYNNRREPDKNPYTDYYIFLSASNDPSAPNERGFELVHDSLGPFDTPTVQNSVKYTATLTGSDDSNTADGLSSTFTGTDYINGSIPGLGITTRTHSNTGSAVRYAQFTGSIDITMQDPVPTLPGRYTGEIYIHVVSDGT